MEEPSEQRISCVNLSGMVALNAPPDGRPGRKRNAFPLAIRRAMLHNTHIPTL